MARQDASVSVAKRQVPVPAPPQRRLEYLLNETYVKIDELKELLRKEAALTGTNGSSDLAVGRMFSRQDYLISLCAEACQEHERRNALMNQNRQMAHHHQQQASSSSQARIKQSVKPGPSSSIGQTEPVRRSAKSEKDEAKSDGGWYGSLDRSLAKKKKHQFFDKKRRHTKTIGSMAGLDVIKKSAELRPDEQYEIGLPAAPRVTSSRSSIFPMTQHQYYTVMMESKMTKKPAYPLEVRQAPPSQYPPPPPPPPPPHSALPPRSMSTWGYQLESLDENKNMKKQMEQGQQQHQHLVPPPPLPPSNPKPNLVPLPCRSLGSEIAFRHSAKASSSKKWYETNLDDSHNNQVIAQNPSPSPSMMSSTRGSSRGSVASGIDTIDAAVGRLAVSSPANESADFTSKSSESSESWSGMGNEVTKPFEMSDYYKYSTKFRSRASPSEESNNESRNTNGGPMSPVSIISHSRTPSQVRQPQFETPNGYRDTNTNGNPSVGPKLPPKQRRSQNKSISSNTTVIFEGDIPNGDPSKEVWITNEPTFV